MIPEINSVVVWMTGLTFINLGIALLCAFYLLLRGPKLSDRVVALDLIGILIAATAVAKAIESGHHSYLDVAITISLIAFLGTVAFANYIQHLGERRKKGS